MIENAPLGTPGLEGWRGVAQMECLALRELLLTDNAPKPTTLFCYRCGVVEPVLRLARWEPTDA